MKLGKLIVGIGIGTVIGMLCAPKKGSELRKDIKDKSKDLYDKAQNISKEDIQELINNTIDEIKLAIDEFDADEFKETVENIGKIARGANRFITDYIKIVRSNVDDKRLPKRFRFSTLQYFHKELSIL